MINTNGIDGRYYANQQLPQNNQLNLPITGYNPNPYFLGTPITQQQQQNSVTQYNPYIPVTVTSIQEIGAMRMQDLTATYIFPMINQGKIYIKRMGNNGLAEIIEFSAITPQQQINPEIAFNDLNSRVTKLEEMAKLLTSANNTTPQAGV